jgi:hypothetical protein
MQSEKLATYNWLKMLALDCKSLAAPRMKSIKTKMKEGQPRRPYDCENRAPKKYLVIGIVEKSPSMKIVAIPIPDATVNASSNVDKRYGRLPTRRTALVAFQRRQAS